ncbi:MAG: TetR/AcrR family transcriptional regulator C-terminal domain-containing protein, partial [Chloroflexota bacterium]
YNHFSGKDELALAAFDYNWNILLTRYKEAISSVPDSPAEQLLAAIGVHASFADNPPMEGGCPLLNTAIENDDGHIALQQKAREAFTYWHKLLSTIVQHGIVSGDFRPEVEPDQVATIIISTLEGGITLGKIMQDEEYIRTATNHLYTHIESAVLA